MVSLRRVIAAVTLISLSGLGACKDADDITGLPPGAPVVTTQLQCGISGGPLSPCTLPIVEKARFEVTLVSSSCAARGNKIRLILPLDQLLSSDACYEPVGSVWRFDGPYEPGAKVDFAVDAAPLPNPAELRVTGAWPTWTVTFEDGGDADYDDVIIEVKATPVH